MANRGRLVHLRAAIRNNPKVHSQRSWAVQSSCGTTYCMAGSAAVLAGEEIDWDTALVDLDGVLSATELKNGQEIDDFAANWLGLTKTEAFRFFYCMSESESLEMLDDLIAAAD